MGGTVIRPLSRGAHGLAVPLIIDVVGNLCRQETKLPAVPAHYDIIWEGWPTAGVVSCHPSRPAAPAVDLLTCRQMNTVFTHCLPDRQVRRCAPPECNGGEGKENPGRVLQLEDKQNFELFKKRMQHVGVC